MNNSVIFITIFLTSLVLTIACTRILIPIIASKKYGQKILECGPNWHKKKEGTPTMGGIGFIIPIIICFILFFFILRTENQTREILCTLNVLIYAVLNALIGIIDDLAKIRKKQNEGLTPLKKFMFQSVAAILFLVSFKLSVGIDTSIVIPFSDVRIELGFMFYIIAFFVLCGFVNAVNLTDGIDGLASSVTLTVSVLFLAVSLTIDSTPLLFFSSSVLGAMLGFLVFNFHPAKIFMGDTGSLFLGAIVVSYSFISNNIILVLLYGFVFLCEAMSDIIQVVYFKLSKGKRILKMAPLHHHFEKCGWSEVKIVSVFTVVNLIFCILAYLSAVKLWV